jgi:hypothetical protein
MWSPKPKGKVIRRPKPCLKERRKTTAMARKDKGDPHRDVRYFGIKHSDITQILFLDSTNSFREYPTGPFEKKQSDIRAYLERTVPSHATEPVSSTGQQTSAQVKRNERWDTRGCFPMRLPSACNSHVGTTKMSKRDPASAAGTQENENIRPTTAATGEMRRLSAANTPALSTNRSGTVGTKRGSTSKPGAVDTSRPGTRDSGLGSVLS